LLPSGFFKDKGINFEEIDLTGNDEERQKLQERTHRHTVPQIFIGDTHVGGYDDLRALDRAGGLLRLLEGSIGS